MKAVLLSVKPKWCELIFNGRERRQLSVVKNKKIIDILTEVK